MIDKELAKSVAENVKRAEQVNNDLVCTKRMPMFCKHVYVCM